MVESNPLIILVMSSLSAFLNVKVFGSSKLTLINSILGCSLYLSICCQLYCHFHEV